MLSRYGHAQIFHLFYYDYSRYMHIYLLRNKNETLDAFIFKVEVKNNVKKIKIVRINRSGGYCGGYIENRQTLDSFAKFL